ncbi:MAG: hypothetical protein VXV96_00375 [Bdellovibrionota bacterium]|nr:hypothetical protein [Bdellovibrionota bacterium]
MAFLKTISDQVTLNFTGRVNILDKKNNKFLGKVSLLEGAIVYSSYEAKVGKSTLYDIIIEDLEGENLRFVVEPEIVTLSEAIFELSFDELKVSAQAIFQQYKESRKMLPPPHLRLMIDPDFVARGPSVSFWEFETLTVISDFNKVSDIFLESPLSEYQTSLSLVSLRKKGALKVLGQ